MDQDMKADSISFIFGDKTNNSPALQNNKLPKNIIVFHQANQQVKGT